MESSILSIATGTIKSYETKNDNFLSAYKKDTFYNFINLSQNGIQTDEQADKKHHGDSDKAMLIASNKHFERFEKEYGKSLDKLAMGQNILIDSLDEDDICVGDIWTIDDIELEVTQPRQPCWKIGAIFDKDISQYIKSYHATGWYVRVLNEGVLDVNDDMILKKRVSDITIKQLSQYLKTPPTDEKLIKEILGLPALAEAYKKDFKKQIPIQD